MCRPKAEATRGTVMVKTSYKIAILIIQLPPQTMFTLYPIAFTSGLVSLVFFHQTCFLSVTIHLSIHR